MTSGSKSQTWHFALKAAEVPAEGHVATVVADQMVVIYRMGGEWYCLEDVCTHDGGPLSDGQRCGHEVVCPRHGARFDLRDGKALSMPATEDTRSFPVREDNGNIYVAVD